MILSPPPPKSLSVKVPTTSKVQFGEPFFCTVRQMSGIRSPIFHPYFFAVASSTNAAVRDLAKASRSWGAIAKVKAVVQSLSGVTATLRTPCSGFW